MVNNLSLWENSKLAFRQALSWANLWFQSMQLQFMDWWQNLDLTPFKIIEISSYLASGFIVGLLLKKYLRSVLIFAILFSGLVWLLGVFDLIVINWNQAQNFVHIAPDDTLGTIYTSFMFWVKANLIMVVSSLIGLVIGCKVG